MTEQLPGALYPAGLVRITAGAVAALSAADQHAAGFLLRHLSGDWGEIGTADPPCQFTERELRECLTSDGDSRRENLLALQTGERSILSQFTTRKGEAIFRRGTATETVVYLPSER